jgi:hypothetical protein
MRFAPIFIRLFILFAEMCRDLNRVGGANIDACPIHRPLNLAGFDVNGGTESAGHECKELED